MHLRKRYDKGLDVSIEHRGRSLRSYSYKIVMMFTTTPLTTPLAADRHRAQTGHTRTGPSYKHYDHFNFAEHARMHYEETQRWTKERERQREETRSRLHLAQGSHERTVLMLLAAIAIIALAVKGVGKRRNDRGD